MAHKSWRKSHTIHLCKICTKLDVAFVKTSSGYGFVKKADGNYNYKGATYKHLKNIRQHFGAKVGFKASSCVRTLDDLLKVRSFGVTRIGATARLFSKKAANVVFLKHEKHCLPERLGQFPPVLIANSLVAPKCEFLTSFGFSSSDLFTNAQCSNW